MAEILLISDSEVVQQENESGSNESTKEYKTQNTKKELDESAKRSEELNDGQKDLLNNEYAEASENEETTASNNNDPMLRKCSRFTQNVQNFGNRHSGCDISNLGTRILIKYKLSTVVVC